MRVLRVSSHLALCVATAASTTAYAPTYAAAAPRDGAPTAQACEALGFTPPREDRDDYHGRRIYGPPPPMVAPSPRNQTRMPPLSAPPVERRLAQPTTPLQEMVVTGALVSPKAGARRPGSTRMAGDIETERYPHAQMNPIKRTAEEPVSTFSVDVDTAAYANMRRMLNNGTTPPTDAVRVEELINYFDYGYEKPADSQAPFKPFVAVVPSPWSADRQIVQIGLQGYDIPRAQQPPLNLVFLIDTSGSMSSEDRLPLAKKALNLLIDQLAARRTGWRWWPMPARPARCSAPPAATRS